VSRLRAERRVARYGTGGLGSTSACRIRGFSGDRRVRSRSARSDETATYDQDLGRRRDSFPDPDSSQVFDRDNPTVRITLGCFAGTAGTKDGFNLAEQGSAGWEGLRGLFPEWSAEDYCGSVFSQT